MVCVFSVFEELKLLKSSFKVFLHKLCTKSVNILHCTINNVCYMGLRLHGDEALDAGR